MNLVENEVAARLRREFLNAANGDFGGVVEVVDDNHPESSQQELKNGVAANISGTAGDQYALCHYPGAWTVNTYRNGENSRNNNNKTTQQRAETARRKWD